MAKTSLPPIDDELAQLPKKRVDLKSIRTQAALDDEQVAANSRKLGEQWGASTSLDASMDAPAPAESTPTPAKATSVASLRIEVPSYLDDELHQKAAAQRVTKQFLVMQALKQAGYKIHDVDLVEDRRKVRRKG